MRAPRSSATMSLLGVASIFLVCGCASSRHLTDEQKIERGKVAAVAAIQAPDTWRRLGSERLTQEKPAVDATRVGHRDYVAQVDTVAYRKGEALIIYTVPTGVRFGLHSTFVDVTVRRDTGDVLGLHEYFYP